MKIIPLVVGAPLILLGLFWFAQGTGLLPWPGNAAMLDYGAGVVALGIAIIWLYPVHVTTRKSLGLMMRKLSVTESQRSAQFRGTFSRRKPSVASANWAQVA